MRARWTPALTLQVSLLGLGAAALFTVLSWGGVPWVPATIAAVGFGGLGTVGALRRDRRGAVRDE